MNTNQSYWHGGRGGLQRGAFLLPPVITKARSCSEYGAAGVHRRDKVYVTIDQAVALLYAAAVKNGMIYQCEPIGTLEPDPDCDLPGLSWQCEKARIVRCIKPKKTDIEKARTVLMNSFL